jgi:hypothetical protein
MPAIRKHALALGLALAGLVACAANPRQDAAPMGSHPALDEMPAAGAAEPSPVDALAPAAEVEDLEASLAAYEQQLAYNETRLRAMGVRIAAIGEAEAQTDDRFAPPPPARPNDAGTRSEERAKAKKAESGVAGGTATSSTTPGTAPAPRPQPTTKSATKPTTPKQPARAAGGDNKPDAEAKNADADASNRCGELCELADATCDLEAKICDLAARHAGEPRYAEVCRRASDDCRLASDACNVCSP